MGNISNSILTGIEKAGELSELVSKFADSVVSRTICISDSEVNYRPAAQQWTVCTP